MDARIGQRAVDQDAVAGIRHIGELGDVVLAQEIVELVLPPRLAVGHCHGLQSIPGSLTEIASSREVSQREPARHAIGSKFRDAAVEPALSRAISLYATITTRDRGD